MLALFDTNIYIGDLADAIPGEQTQAWRAQYILRLSPVVFHELLRGTREPHLIEEIGRKTILTPAPTAKMWKEGAQILRKFVSQFGFGEEIFKLQNDILIALTARHIGAVVITQDGHFADIAKIVPYHYIHYRSPH